jgi:hypothetical protein
MCVSRSYSCSYVSNSSAFERLAQSLNRIRLFSLPRLQHRHRLLAGANLRVACRAVAGELQKAPEPLGHRPLHLKRIEQLAGKLVPEEELQVVAADLDRRLLVLPPGDHLERSFDVPGRLQVMLAQQRERPLDRRGRQLYRHSLSLSELAARVGPPPSLW